MKIGGKEITKQVHEDVLILPRGDDAIAIRARAITEYEEFDNLCPAPTPPGKLTKDGFIPDTNDVTYKSQIERHGLQRLGWMVINSLQDVEWTTVKPDNPKTWPNWETEMKEAGFSSVERNLIIGLVLEVN